MYNAIWIILSRNLGWLATYCEIEVDLYNNNSITLSENETRSAVIQILFWNFGCSDNDYDYDELMHFSFEYDLIIYTIC